MPFDASMDDWDWDRKPEKRIEMSARGADEADEAIYLAVKADAHKPLAQLIAEADARHAEHAAGAISCTHVSVKDFKAQAERLRLAAEAPAVVR